MLGYPEKLNMCQTYIPPLSTNKVTSFCKTLNESGTTLAILPVSLWLKVLMRVCATVNIKKVPKVSELHIETYLYMNKVELLSHYASIANSITVTEERSNQPWFTFQM